VCVNKRMKSTCVCS